MTYSDALSLTAASGAGVTSLYASTAIKKVVATPLVNTVWSGSALDGDDNIDFRFERAVTITTSSSVGAYETTKLIEIHGVDSQNRTVVGTIQLQQANGNEVRETSVGFRRVRAIYCPAQLTGAGTISVGIGAVRLSTPCQAIEVGTAGVVKIGTDAGTINLTLPANQLREIALTYVARDNVTFPLNLYR